MQPMQAATLHRKPAAKPLQTATWLLLTAYGTHQCPIQRYYRRTYRLATIHKITDRQTDDSAYQ